MDRQFAEAYIIAINPYNVFAEKWIVTICAVSRSISAVEKLLCTHVFWCAYPAHFIAMILS